MRMGGQQKKASGRIADFPSQQGFIFLHSLLIDFLEFVEMCSCISLCIYLLVNLLGPSQ